VRAAHGVEGLLELRLELAQMPLLQRVEPHTSVFQKVRQSTSST
jgi:hypothetical protein